MFKKRDRGIREFEGLLLPLMKPLYGMALRMTRNEKDAEDLVQETSMKAFRAFKTFTRGTNFKAWVFRIMTNTFINIHHQRNRDNRLVHDLEKEDHYDRFLSNGPARMARDPEAEILDRMMSEDIAAALEELPEEFRLAVILCDIEGFSYKEIAEILKCPIGTVMSRLYRGRRHLQNLLYEHAVQQGIIAPQTGHEEIKADTEDNVTRLDTYRKSKKQNQ